MSKLEELIARLCPDGVEYKELVDCCEILDNKRKPVTKSARVNGVYPYYGANGIQDYVADYIFDGEFVLVGEDGSVVNKDGSPVVTWARGKIWVNNHAHIITGIESVLLRYLYHYLQTVNVSVFIHGNIPKLTGKDFKAIKVPVPPLEVQREIVHILDSYTASNNELKDQLEKEFAARQKQYEFYRDALLTFKNIDDTILNERTNELELSDVVRWMKLKDVADIGTGSSNTNEAEDGGVYPFFVRSQEPLRKNSYEYDETAIITAGDGVGVGKVFHFVNGKYALHQRAYRIHINVPYILPKYFFYYMKSNFLPYINKNMFQGSVSSIRRPMLNDYPVPVPPLSEQQRIVDILDRFDALCNDITSGLPAEIEARRKQYEYYRDKLLTFKELKKEA